MNPDIGSWVPLPRPISTGRRATVPRVDDSDSALNELPVVPGPQVIRRSDHALIRFTVDVPDATAVACVANTWIDGPGDAAELTRVGPHRWTAAFRVPLDWRTSYRFAIHRGSDDPAWRTEGLRAAGEALTDPTNPIRNPAGRGGDSSVIWLPPEAPWLQGFGSPAIDTIDLAQVRPRMWTWSPGGTGLPLLVLFDGERHRAIGTPRLIEAAIAQRVLAPLAVLLVEGGPPSRRPRDLGVPGGDVDHAADMVRRLHEVGLPDGSTLSADRTQTMVSGSSFGGLSTLFALARHADLFGSGLAQSPSLWRYPDHAFVPVLAQLPQTQVRVHAGRFEGSLLEAATGLTGHRGAEVQLQAVSGGHDWAWWVPLLIEELIREFPAT